MIAVEKPDPLELGLQDKDEQVVHKASSLGEQRLSQLYIAEQRQVGSCGAMSRVCCHQVRWQASGLLSCCTLPHVEHSVLL